MNWIKAFHIIFMVSWFAGLFYLPRLFVYHADTKDSIGDARFCIMEHKLFRFIMTPAAILTVLSGLCLLSANFGFYLHQPWMIAKLICVLLLIAYHVYCGHLVRIFKNHQNTHSHRFYRFFNEIPTVLLIAIVLLIVVH